MEKSPSEKSTEETYLQESKGKILKIMRKDPIHMRIFMLPVIGAKTFNIILFHVITMCTSFQPWLT